MNDENQNSNDVQSPDEPYKVDQEVETSDQPQPSADEKAQLNDPAGFRGGEQPAEPPAVEVNANDDADVDVEVSPASEDSE